jgi:ribosome-binding factor A
MADPARARKVADRIKVVVAETLEHRVKDERLGFTTITDVRVTGDLQNATIFYTAYGSDDDRAASAAALESAKGKLRTAVGKALGIRLTPSLEFIPDALPEGPRTSRTSSSRRAPPTPSWLALRQGAVYAGDAGPVQEDRRRRAG